MSYTVSKPDPFATVSFRNSDTPQRRSSRCKSRSSYGQAGPEKEYHLCTKRPHTPSVVHRESVSSTATQSSESSAQMGSSSSYEPFDAISSAPLIFGSADSHIQMGIHNSSCIGSLSNNPRKLVVCTIFRVFRRIMSA